MNFAKVGGLIDGTGEAPRRDLLLAMNAGRIVDVTSDMVVDPAEREVLDLSHCWVLPGLVDAHEHLAFEPSPDHASAIATLLGDTPEIALLRAAQHAQQSLLAGVTTVRDCGGPCLTTLALRDAIAKGMVTGPTVLASGPAITTTAGHLHFLGATADTADELVKQARRLIEAGADFIKVCLTGGNMTAGTNPYACQYELADLARLVKDVHRLGRQVAVHAHATAGIKLAVRAGVDFVEHCSWASADGGSAYDEETVRRLADGPQYATFTFVGIQRALLPDASGKGGDLARLRENLAVHRRMVAEGVKFSVASDAGVRLTPFSGFAQTLEVAVRGADLDPLAAIQAATKAPAEALGLGNTLGTLEVGKAADFVAVVDNPLTDVRALRHVEAVVKGGQLAVWQGRLQPARFG
ncbi:MAG: amidohydrolase family protein [Chloroflexi bacterium]|nr:amidohydrolase family protein [Chloroflexota bacterium]MCL5107674.1 amidohydrolase family protein [Chloroflexota bacterium]